MSKSKEPKYGTPTRLIYGKAQAEEWDYSHHVVSPMTTSSTFRLESAGRGAKGFSSFAADLPDELRDDLVYIYDRLGEPNTDLLQNRLAMAEEGEIAVTFATGMAAVHAAVGSFVTQGDELLSHRTIYGCSYSLFSVWLPRFGVRTGFVDMTDPQLLKAAITADTRVVYLESPANPNLEMLDLEAIVAVVREANKDRSDERRIITVIDNTFATPFCQRPLNWGIDIVLHSLTKGISGFGTDMGGAVVTRKEFRNQLLFFRKDFGGSLSPRSAWHVLEYGLTTLPLRMRKQQESARRVAKFLENHPAVQSVRYPGLKSFPQYEIAQKYLRDYDGDFAPGSMLYFVVDGKDLEDQKARGERLMDYIAANSYSITLAVSLGQIRTLIEHPGSMTHSAYPAEDQVSFGIDPGGIRLALGIEETDDIIADLEDALKHAG